MTEYICILSSLACRWDAETWASLKEHGSASLVYTSEDKKPCLTRKEVRPDIPTTLSTSTPWQACTYAQRGTCTHISHTHDLNFNLKDPFWRTHMVMAGLAARTGLSAPAGHTECGCCYALTQTFDSFSDLANISSAQRLTHCWLLLVTPDIHPFAFCCWGPFHTVQPWSNSR